MSCKLLSGRRKTLLRVRKKIHVTVAVSRPCIKITKYGRVESSGFTVVVVSVTRCNALLRCVKNKTAPDLRRTDDAVVRVSCAGTSAAAETRTTEPRTGHVRLFRALRHCQIFGFQSSRDSFFNTHARVKYTHIRGGVFIRDNTVFGYFPLDILGARRPSGRK